MRWNVQIDPATRDMECHAVPLGGTQHRRRNPTGLRILANQELVSTSFEDRDKMGATSRQHDLNNRWSIPFRDEIRPSNSTTIKTQRFSYTLDLGEVGIDPSARKSKRDLIRSGSSAHLANAHRQAIGSTWRTILGGAVHHHHKENDGHDDLQLLMNTMFLGGTNAPRETTNTSATHHQIPNVTPVQVRPVSPTVAALM